MAKKAARKKSLDSFSEYKVLQDKISKNQKNVEKLEEQIRKDSEKLFKTGCKRIFETHNFKSFAWTQYTPHWNDGDSCEFSAQTDYIYVDDEEESVNLYDVEQDIKDLEQKDKTIERLQKEIDKSKQEWETQSKKNRIEELNSLKLEDVNKKYEFLKDISELLSTINDNTYESMFGDHAKVVVTKDGVEVESYKHD